MAYSRFDRDRIRFRPLADRENRVSSARDIIPLSAFPHPVPGDAAEAFDSTVRDVRAARKAGRPVILAFGAHAIKNGLGRVLIALMEEGWLTHLATNGAGIIHDWELSFLGATSEDVRTNVEIGEFGIWDETGRYLNLAIAVGAYRGWGYGESVGRMIQDEAIDIPSPEELLLAIADAAGEAAGKPGQPGAAGSGEYGRAGEAKETVETLDRAAAAFDLLSLMRKFSLLPGRLAVSHPHRDTSVQAAACRLGIPFTGHPMLGHDIIYTHPMNLGAAIGRTGLRDFLSYANSVSHLEGGVYLSVGSAVMSPMIFEKSLSMSRNVARQGGRKIDDFRLSIVDIAESKWDWTKSGEPPKDDPAYYLRYCKTFSRMGGRMSYLCMDNRDFLLGLYRELAGKSARS
jgi:hypothetical protein